MNSDGVITETYVIFKLANFGNKSNRDGMDSTVVQGITDLDDAIPASGRLDQQTFLR